MKLNHEEMLGGFDGFKSSIRSGRNIKKGMLIYTRFHEDAHRIFNSSIEWGWILYFLKRDSENAAYSKDFIYSNQLTVIINIIEDYMENISEIFANTCELLAVAANGIDVQEYINTCKKNNYVNYCFLFEYVNGLDGEFYDKVNIMIEAVSCTMQKFGIEYIRIGIEEGAEQLKEMLAICERPEITVQRILYGEVEQTRREIDLKDCLELVEQLEELGLLVYLKDYIEIIKSSQFEAFVDKTIRDLDFAEFLFHKPVEYFTWGMIKSKTVTLEELNSYETPFFVVYEDSENEYQGYKWKGEKGIIKSYLNAEELKFVLKNVKYVMYDVTCSNQLIEMLSEKEDIIHLEFYKDIEAYFEKLIECANTAKFISVGDSDDNAISFGGILCRGDYKKIHISVYNGVYSRMLYNIAEHLEGVTFYGDRWEEFFGGKENFYAFSMALVFCLEATS